MPATESTTDSHEDKIDSCVQVVIEKLGVSAAIDGISPLMAPIENDDRDLVASLIDSKANQRRVSSDSLSALRYAVRHGSVSVAELLISRGSSVSTHDIIEAASQGHEALVNVLVSRYNQENARSLLHLLPKLLQPHTNPKHAIAMDILVTVCVAEVNEVGSDGCSPISRAVSSFNHYLVSALVNAGADFPLERASEIIPQLLKNRHDAAAKTLLSRSPPNIAGAVSYMGRTALHLAKTSELVEMLLRLGCDPNAEDWKNRTPLFYAKNAEIAHKLIDAGALVDHRDRKDSSPLLWARSEDIAAALLQRNADTSHAHNGRGDNGRTFLMKAVKWNNLDLVKSLLELPTAKKVLKMRDYDYCSALGYAVMHGSSVEIIQALIDAGIDVGIKSSGYISQTPLHLATDCETIRLLVDSGAGIDVPDRWGYPLLYHRSGDGDTDAVKLLLSLGANVNIYGDSGLSIRLHTVLRGHIDTMNALIAHLPDLKDLPDKVRTHIHPVFDAVRCPYPHAAIAFLAAWGRMNTRDDDGRTPLMICSNVGIAQHLINSGIRVDDVDNHGMTALHYACMLGRADLVSFLLMRGADASALDSKGRTALHMALDMNHVLAIIALFSSEHSSMEWIDTCDQHGITALHTAVKKDLCDIVACLLAAGAKQTPNGIGKTPLHLARSSFVARILLEAGAKDVKDVNGYTALMYACEKGERALVDVLSRRKYGCDVNAVNNKGETALSLAYQHSVRYAFPTLLLSSLLDINLWKNEEGCTLLNLAATSYYPETVERLLAAGADPMLEDDYGDIPLTVVREEESMQLLIEATPYSVYHSHFHGRTMLMRMCARMDMESFHQLFLSCSEHDVTIEIDEIDDSGDSALDIAMMILHSECVQELLCKGAEVLGTGWQDMTVLMKPFLDHDDELTEIHYRDIRLLRDESEDDKDLMTQRCLELVLSQLHRKLTFPTMWTPRTSTVKRRDGGRGPPAKRRRR